MAWLQLVFDSDRGQAPLLEDALLELGALSVTLQDNADEPVFEPGVGETPLWSSTRVVALLAEDTDIDAMVTALQKRVPALPTCRIERVEDQAWERAWMDNFQPLRFGRRLWVCPSWCAPPDPAGVVLALDPGLAFGTGTHPTTALCLEWLDAQSLAGSTVVDYGCGSGILAIAALLLGADRAVAVDNDPQALIATRDNAERNGIPPERLTTCLPDDVPEIRADTVIANILAGPLQSLAPTLARLCATGGQLALSGILAEQAEAVAMTYRQWFTMTEPAMREGWVRLNGRRMD